MAEWTERAVDELTKLWPQFSCSEISRVIAAKGLGDYSRNAVIGKIHRLNLGVKRKPAEPKGPRVRTNSTPEGSLAFKVIHGIKRRQRQQKIKSAKFACAVVPGLHPQNVPLLECDGCRWPTTDQLPHLFCNLPQHENSSYCPAHFLRSVGDGTPSERAADKLPKMVA